VPSQNSRPRVVAARQQPAPSQAALQIARSSPGAWRTWTFQRALTPSWLLPSSVGERREATDKGARTELERSAEQTVVAKARASCGRAAASGVVACAIAP